MTAEGNVVVVVDVVVVVKGATHPTIGIVVTDGSDDGGHNTGTDVVVVVVAPDATIGDAVMNAATKIGTTNRERRIFHTLLMQNTPEQALEQRY